MPNYILPPWLTNQPSPIEQYTRGVQLGAQVAQQRQQLAAQREQAAMSAAVRQQELEQESIRQQQNLLMTKAYHDAQVGLRERELDQAQQRIAMQTEVAARKAASQMAYTRRVQAGEDPAKVLLEMGPELGVGMSGAASLAKMTAPTEAFIPSTARIGEKDGAQADLVQVAPGKWQQIVRQKEPVPGYVSQKDRATISELKDERKELVTKFSNPLYQGAYSPQEYSAATNRIAQIGQDIKKIINQAPVAAPAAAPAAKGRVYTDASGKRWRYIGTNPNPKSDRDEANWVEEEETR